MAAASQAKERLYTLNVNGPRAIQGECECYFHCAQQVTAQLGTRYSPVGMVLEGDCRQMRRADGGYST